jgi:HTH-type transcriptional regulator/antitoxin HigA
MQHRTLNGILDGTQKNIDFTNLIKIASFLQIPKMQVTELYLNALENNYPTYTISSDKIKFIKENFDLAVFKKAGFIDSITDFRHIEERLLSRLGLKSIFEYKRLGNDVAFSSGLFKPKNEITRSFWIGAARTIFEELANPYEYNKQALIEYFPQLRWHSTNVERGLVEVVKSLFKLGITVIYQPSLHTLQLRGATFSVNEKPCIVLTNYVGFYATLWFSLIHELYHVLFDWDDIRVNSYHLTDDDNDQLTVREREDLADNFARQYLFSKEKTEEVKRYLNDSVYIREVALNNHVHPSIIYVFNAFDVGSKDRMAWARARSHSPEAVDAVKAFDIPWSEDRPVEKVINKLKTEIYN